MTDQSSDAACCPVCGSSASEALEPPHPTRSVTSGGIILDTPLRKIQCLECGLARQRLLPDAVKAELYRDKYALYHQRPGTSNSESARYAAMAESDSCRNRAGYSDNGIGHWMRWSNSC